MPTLDVMHVQMTGQPAYTAAQVTFEAGEGLLVEPGALVGKSAGVRVTTALPGGVVKSLTRKVAGGEQVFAGHYVAEIGGAFIVIGTRFPGDMVHVSMPDHTPDITVTRGALVAWSYSLNVSGALSGWAAVATREGVTALRIQGAGELLLGTYGAVMAVELQSADQYFEVDTGHLVAWSSSCQLEMCLNGNVVTQATSGEGVMARVHGPGTLWMQTRAEQDLRGVLFPEGAQNTGRK